MFEIIFGLIQRKSLSTCNESSVKVEFFGIIYSPMSLARLRRVWSILHSFLSGNLWRGSVDGMEKPE